MNFYILAGGHSRRMGQNKALLTIAGETVIARILRLLPADNSHKIIISNSPGDFGFLPNLKIADLRPDLGPISGIHAGLHHSSYRHNFFIACDLPLVTGALIGELVERLDRHDLLAFRTSNGFEPLCAIYSQACLPHIEGKLREGSLGLQDLPDLVNSLLLPADNPDHFLNMNSKQDLQRALRFLKQSR